MNNITKSSDSEGIFVMNSRINRRILISYTLKHNHFENDYANPMYYQYKIMVCHGNQRISQRKKQT